MGIRMRKKRRRGRRRTCKYCTMCKKRERRNERLERTNMLICVDTRRLKLKLYRSLGIDLETDAQGQVAKAVVRNTQRGSVNVIPLEASLPRTAYADRLWDAL